VTRARARQKNSYKFSLESLNVRDHLEDTGTDEDNIKTDLNETGYGGVD
jgi:hypothetical protein